MEEPKHVTCVSVGMYDHALSRGAIYEVVNVKNHNYRIKGNHGRLVYISNIHFIEGIVAIPILESWIFDDDINQRNFIDVTLTFNDGSKRWTMVSTPEKLLNHFSENVNLRGFYNQHLIILRSIEHGDVEATFRTLDRNGELEFATHPLTE